MLLAFLLNAPLDGLAQPKNGPADNDREQAFTDALRAQDPAAADRFVALRDARERALSELRTVETRYIAVGPELRPAFVTELRQARRNYAQTSLAFLDFLDERDRDAIARYQQEVGRIDQLLDERRKTRAELEKLLKD
jgi:hypothetical protein